MEWGTFITVVIALYLAWYGFNFLFDLFVSGRPKAETSPNILYNVGDLMAEEEKPQTVDPQDYEDKPIGIRPTPAPAPQEGAETGSSGQNITAPAPVAVQTPVQTLEPEPEEVADWASVIDQEEEVVQIPTQGQPISVADFIQNLKGEAKLETSLISF